MKSVKTIERKSVYIKLNGVSWDALKGERWKKQIGFKASLDGNNTYKVLTVNSLEKWRIPIRFNGNIG